MSEHQAAAPEDRPSGVDSGETGRIPAATRKLGLLHVEQPVTLLAEG
ncbi:MAG: hypothetical protein HOV79_32515 [Hamadaea sp.]|nr:hypothetical protein [Hamadaea sp.]